MLFIDKFLFFQILLYTYIGMRIEVWTMKRINFPMLLLAIIVVAMFSLVGIAIHYANFWLVGLFLLLGFAFMGFGLKIRKTGSASES